MADIPLLAGFNDWLAAHDARKLGTGAIFA